MTPPVRSEVIAGVLIGLNVVHEVFVRLYVVWVGLRRLVPEHGIDGSLRALGAVLDWADQSMPRTVCLIDPDNAPSLRLAARLGYTEYAQTTYKDHPITLLARAS